MKAIAIVSTVLVFGSGIGLGYASTPKNVRPLEVEPALESHISPPFRAPNLDAYAIAPHNDQPEVAKVKLGMARLHFVCGRMAPMVGRVDGAPNAFYGRVSRCEWM